jgi:CHAT domain-containing protein
MATGSRTILLSRWRDGGRTSHDLVREFVRELPYRSASQAWQRSVRLAVSSDLAWNLEPRIKELPPDTPPMRAEHPLFWAGYLLVDTGVVPKSD